MLLLQLTLLLLAGHFGELELGLVDEVALFLLACRVELLTFAALPIYCW